MAYRIIISLRAQIEIEKAIDYYSLNSADAPVNFIKELNTAYSILTTVPYFRIRYKNVREFKLKKFPFSLYFIIDENKNIVRILSCFHQKRNPDNKP